MERRNLIAFGCGPTGSGKSRMLRELFTNRTPRVLSIDPVGEYAGDASVIRTYGLPATLEALRDLAGDPAWHIAAALELEEFAALARVLCPPVTSDDSTSYPRAVGGMALECGECDVIFPNRGCPDEIRQLPKRARHYSLSLYMATQRPAECDRLVTSQAHIVYSFRQHEPNDLQFIRRTLSSAIAERVRRLELYHSVYYVKATGAVYICGPDYRPVEVLSLDGSPLAGESTPRAAVKNSPRRAVAPVLSPDERGR